MFHRVLPASRLSAFAPNARLQVRTKFFETAIEHLLRSSYDIVAMSEAKRRLESHHPRKFVCLTFDDGYRDNYEHAYRICRRFGVPMTVYIVTGFLDRSCSMWWLGLERLLAGLPEVGFTLSGNEYHFSAENPRTKLTSFWGLSALFSRASLTEQEELMDIFADRYSVDFRTESDRNTLTWQMVREMAASGTVEFGAHTVSHYSLASLSDHAARSEMAESRRRLADRIARPVDHFAYPFGGRAHARSREFLLAHELGFATAVTTRHGNLMAAHRDHVSCLPRISVNGHHQSLAALRVYLSGASAALANGLKPLVTD